MYVEGNECFQNPVSVTFTLFFMRYVKSYQQVQLNLTFIIWAIIETGTQCRFVIAWEFFSGHFVPRNIINIWRWLSNLFIEKHPFCKVVGTTLPNSRWYKFSISLWCYPVFCCLHLSVLFSVTCPDSDFFWVLKVRPNYIF